MATSASTVSVLLDQGIVAAKSGNQLAAKQLLAQALKYNSRNEKAWLWMSGVVDTVGEQILCIEQALKINPQNDTAKQALIKLRAQPAHRLPSAPQLPSGEPSPSTASAPTDNVAVVERRPYRLAEAAAVPGKAYTNIAPASPAPKTISQSPQAAVAEADDPSLNSLPLLPVILFGTLSFTAIGGILMIVLLLLFD